MSFLITAAAAVLVFGSVVFIHEFGHFITAKRAGITVLEFALGMGPKLWSFQRGETLYSLRLLPVGGFCMMEGEEEESESEGSFSRASVWARMRVVAAGAVSSPRPQCTALWRAPPPKRAALWWATPSLR